MDNLDNLDNLDKNEFYSKCGHIFDKNGISGYATEEILQKLYNLTEIMLDTGNFMNVTSLRDSDAIIARHFADCLLAAEYLPENAKILDVGSGGGMPALPFAIARPDIHVAALDATAKKTAYIKECAEGLGLKNLSVITGRAEELGADSKYREKFDVVTARAVAELRTLLEWCVPFVKSDGIFIAFKGKNAENELSASENAMKTLFCELEKDCELYLYENEETELSRRHIMIFKKLKPTDKKYPRRNSAIMKNPL